MKGKMIDERTQWDTRTITLVGVLMALTCVVTMMVHIPIPGTKGYLNPGDALVLFSALTLGRKKGALVGGVGSAMADLFLGYAHYVPITLVVKGLEGYLCGRLYEKTGKTLPWVLVAGQVMAIGYLIAEIPLYGRIAAMGSYLPNVGQGLFGSICAVILFRVLGEALEKRVRV